VSQCDNFFIERRNNLIIMPFTEYNLPCIGFTGTSSIEVPIVMKWCLPIGLKVVKYDG